MRVKMSKNLQILTENIIINQVRTLRISVVSFLYSYYLVTYLNSILKINTHGIIMKWQSQLFLN